MEHLPYQNIKEQLQSCRSKEETFKALVTLSKTLIRLTPEDKIDSNLVKGCETAVWLIIDRTNNIPQFKADSDAKLMRGILVTILSLIEGRSTHEIQSMDLSSELAQLNLGSYLTQSRTNGVLSILKKIAQT